ncbi:MAG TPA: glutathione peroxidase, partial [Caulobacteraceae bacterium]|nr:glutathione peroxidase [Caulobacteraceae bacterium]
MAENLYDISINRIDGSAASLGAFAGKVILVVNVASRCGLTPQYEGLEKLYDTYKDEGLVVAGFPANEFAGQEPGSNAEIADFCETRFGVQFPMFEK